MLTGNYALYVYKAIGYIPYRYVSIYKIDVKQTLHFTCVAAVGQVKTYSRTVALNSIFERRV